MPPVARSAIPGVRLPASLMPVAVQEREMGIVSPDNPVPPTTDVFNGAAVSLSGTLRAVDRQAVVLDSGTKTYWIPKDCVLLIEVEK